MLQTTSQRSTTAVLSYNRNEIYAYSYHDRSDWSPYSIYPFDAGLQPGACRCATQASLPPSILLGGNNFSFSLA